VGTSIAKGTPEIANNVDSNEAGSRFRRLAIATALQPNPAFTPKPTSLTVVREPPPLSSLSRIGERNRLELGFSRAADTSRRTGE
jgi:hypothetical protein